MRNLLTLLLIITGLTVSSPGFAAPDEGSVIEKIKPPPAVALQGNGLTLDQAVERAKRQCNGRIVSAETKRSGNRETHVIKCLTQDGTVRTFRFPGKRSG